MSNVQVIKCKCGSRFAACTEPECYTEKEWVKELRKYVLNGCMVEMADSESFRFEKCKCKELAQPENPNQLTFL